MSDPNVLRTLVLPGAVLQNIAFFAVPALFIFAKYGLPLRRIGLPPRPRRRDVLAGITLGLLALLAFGIDRLHKLVQLGLLGWTGGEDVQVAAQHT